MVEVAHHVRGELEALGLRAAVKTSGATGLYVVLPLPEFTPAETARLRRGVKCVMVVLL